MPVLKTTASGSCILRSLACAVGSSDNCGLWGVLCFTLAVYAFAVFGYVRRRSPPSLSGGTQPMRKQR